LDSSLIREMLEIAVITIMSVDRQFSGLRGGTTIGRLGRCSGRVGTKYYTRRHETMGERTREFGRDGSEGGTGTPAICEHRALEEP
jgi:hypothetical protein